MTNEELKMLATLNIQEKMVNSQNMSFKKVKKQNKFKL